MPAITRSVLTVLLALLCGSAQAEQFVDQGSLRLHYNALSSNALTAKVAREYGIRRSAARGVVVITPQDLGNDLKPTTAVVSGKMRNLVGQVRQLEFRELREAQAIYYVAEFSFSHMETLRFLLEVRENPGAEPVPLQFVQQFYRDP